MDAALKVPCIKMDGNHPKKHVLDKKKKSQFYIITSHTGASLVAQLVKNLLAMRETWIRSLGWEDPLEKGTATHSSILA